MELESRIQALIAVGSSVSTNCQPCLQSAVALALDNGATEPEIAEVITIGKRVRGGVSSKMDTFASEVIAALPSPVVEANGTCECSLL